ncbi:stalk domain-containing protein [Ammoniphilus sp. YIM 78166]|uniref:stalk domain-containing protein n=1 Tax=Ammoniphilus sp. YIM 78166 TaxID=1644106 RepID=UPI00142FB35F|nr:stalk domain-containing protein [Ammoniphilus sp. YIM 78166]
MNRLRSSFLRIFTVLVLTIVAITGGLGIDSVQAYGNVALGKSVTASGYVSPYEPSRVVDGNTSATSRWYYAPGPEDSMDKWVQIDLGSFHRMDRWVVRGMGVVPGWEEDRNPRDLRLQRSLDGVSWIEVDRVAGSSTSVIDSQVSPFAARYVRIVVDYGNQWNNQWTSLMEVEVYGELFIPAPPQITGVTNGAVYNTDRTLEFIEGTATLNGTPIVNGTTVREEGAYTLIVTNEFGYTTTVLFAIDKTPPDNPRITVSSSDPTNEEVTVSVSYPDDAVERWLKMGEFADYTAVSEFTVTQAVYENTTILAKARDEAGNWSQEVSYTVTNIDRLSPEPPVLTSSPLTPAQSVIVHIEFPEDTAQKEYKLNDGEYQSYTGPIILEENGKVTARGQDEAGNWSGEASIQITNLDRLPPTGTILIDGGNGWTYQSSVTLTLSAVDEGFGVTAMRASEDGQTWGEWKTYNETWSPFPLSSGTGMKTIYIQYRDEAGNASEPVFASIERRVYSDSGSGSDSSSGSGSGSSVTPPAKVTATPVPSNKEEALRLVDAAKQEALQTLSTQAGLEKAWKEIVDARGEASQKAPLSVEEIGTYLAVIEKLTEDKGRLKETIALAQELIERNYGDVGKEFIALLADLYEKAGDRSPKILVDGRVVKMDREPMSVNGRILAPLRALSEVLQAEVFWDQSSQTVTIYRDAAVVKVTIGRKTGIINGRTFVFDVPALLDHGRTFLPLRAISEVLDAAVDYLEKGNIVIVEQ